MATGTGSVTASAPTPSGVGYPGRFGPGEVTAPSLTVLAPGVNGSTGTVSITATAATISAQNQSGKTGIGQVITPVIGVRGGGQPAGITTPSVIVTVTGAIGFSGAGNATVATPATVANGLHGPIGNADVLTPPVTISGGIGSYGDITSSKPSVAAVGTNGRVGVGAIFGGNVSVTSTLESTPLPGSRTGSIVVRAPLVDGVGEQAAIISGSVTVAPVVQGVGVTGRVGSGQITAPGTTVIVSLVQDNTGSVAITVPTAVIEAAGVAAVVSAVFEALSVNTRVNAVTEYTGMNINSMTYFAGKYLAATDNGIVELAGIDDAGTAIVTSVRSGLTDMHSTSIKKIPVGYVVLEASTDISMTMATDNKTERAYTLRPKLSGVHGAKVKYGLSVVGRHWQWGFDSASGSYAVRAITLDVEDTKRRVT
jgi:hypothetical protein